MQISVLAALLPLAWLVTTFNVQGAEVPASSGNAALTLPYGAWPSPITAASVAEDGRSLGSLAFDGQYLYWQESRPQQGGRNTIMRWREGEEPREILPAPWNVRSRVQEYGGRSFVVADGTLWFSNFEDQRLYRLAPDKPPVAITPAVAVRYAGCVIDRERARLLCVREDHRDGGEPRNALVAIPLQGGGEATSEGEVLFAESDFVSAPALSADGSRIAFSTWNHPNMPWDNTSLWSADFDRRGRLTRLANHNPGVEESVINPQWGPRNQLYALSDRDDWWNLYRVSGRQFEALGQALGQAEIGGPDWGIGHNYYHLLAGGEVLAEVRRGAEAGLALIDPASGAISPLALDSVDIIDSLPAGERLFVIAASADHPPQLLETGLDGVVRQRIRSASDTDIGSQWIPAYRLVRFPSGDGAEAHGVYLPPTNPNVRAPAGAAPPLIVTLHGGPTAVSGPSFSVSQLFWTSRGYAILDLNYRGSTGFGRDYRRVLYGQWGVYDVQDAVAGARWLAQQGLADPDRLLIRGGSAGGYTTLAALAFDDTFAAGTSYYGVSDLEALARDTHKFESRYLDQLIGPYPERKDLYRQRSPIHHLEGFNAPLLLLQGLEDQVVPPNQSEMIFAALRSRGIAAAYLAFEGEGHGFRQAANQVRALEAELYFYTRVLGIETAEELPPIAIEGLGAGR